MEASPRRGPSCHVCALLCWCAQHRRCVRLELLCLNGGEPDSCGTVSDIDSVRGSQTDAPRSAEAEQALTTLSSEGHLLDELARTLRIERCACNGLITRFAHTLLLKSACFLAPAGRS